jgi:hypothetical protein
MSEKSSGAHQWLIEFDRKPQSKEQFIEVLDATLKSLNTDYEAKRAFDFILKKPEVVEAPEGMFYRWLRDKNKLGGQHKVPRLSNERQFIDELLSRVNEPANNPSIS